MTLGYMAQVGAPPDPRSLQFRAWEFSREQYLVGALNKPRANTIYVDNWQGSDSNSGLTPATAIKTIAHVNSIMTADTRYRFRSGVIWRESAGLQVTQPNVTIDVYGTGGYAVAGQKAIFQMAPYEFASSAWTLVSGTTYSTPTTNNIGWVRFARPSFFSGGVIAMPTSDLYMEPTHPLYMWSQGSSVATVESATTPTWWYDGSATLYVNAQGASAPANIEAFPFSPTNPQTSLGTLNGVGVGDVDGCYVHGIMAEGYGMSPDAVTQYLPFMFVGNGTNACMFDDCDAFYSSSHIIGHEALAGGGIAVFRRCRAGMYNQQGIPWVFYSPGGGNEGYMLDCETISGPLEIPGQNFYPDQGGFSQSNALVAHCNPSTKFSLIIQRNHRVTSRARNQCAGNAFIDPQFAPTAATIGAARVFIMGFRNDPPLNTNVYPKINTNVSHFIKPDLVTAAETVAINCIYTDYCPNWNLSYTYGGNVGNKWMVNSLHDWRVGDGSNGGINQISGPTGDVWNLINSGIVLRMGGNMGEAAINWWASTAENTGWIVNSELGIEMTLNQGYAVNFVGTIYNSGTITNNAYLGYTVPASDTHAVTPLTVPYDGVPINGDLLYQTGVACPDGVALEYDIDWNPRNLVTPNIGPREVNPGLSVTQAQTVRFGYETGRTLTFRSYTTGSSPTLVQTISLTESPTGSGIYATTTALTLGTPITYTITDSVSGVVGQGVM